MKKEINEYLFLTLILFVFLFFLLVDYLTPGSINIGIMYIIPIVISAFVLHHKPWTYLIIGLSFAAVLFSGLVMHYDPESFGSTLTNALLLGIAFSFIGVIALRLKASIFTQSEYDKLVRTGLAIAPIGICYVDEEGKILYANDSFLKLIDSDGLDIEKNNINNYLWNAKSNRIDHKVAIKKYSQQAIVKKKIFIGKNVNKLFEVEFTYKTIETGKSKTQIFLFKETGERERLLEKLKQNNTKLSFVVEEANEGSWEFNFVNKNLIVSNKFWHFIGKNPQLEPQFDESVVSEDFDRFMNRLEQFALSYSTDIFQEELRCTDIHGMERVFLLKGKCIKTKKDLSPEVMMGIFIDITQQKSLEKYLAESNRSLEQFAYIASHDLKAPIRHIHNYVELLAEELPEEKLGAEANSYINTILKNTKRMKKMVEALLNYARLGYNDLEKTKVDLNQIVEYICETMKEDIDAKGASFHYAKLPRINANKDLVTNLFQNLIGNSLKFHTEGVSPIIKIKYTEAGSMLQISVEDNGIGIEEKNVQEIFSLFKRTKGAQKYEGTGIGLSIAKRIMELHNGKIHFESVESGGSRFILSFPK